MCPRTNPMQSIQIRLSACIGWVDAFEPPPVERSEDRTYLVNRCPVLVPILSRPPSTPTSRTSAYLTYSSQMFDYNNKIGDFPVMRTIYRKASPFCDNHAVSDDQCREPVLTSVADVVTHSLLPTLSGISGRSVRRLPVKDNAAARMIRSTSHFSLVSPFLRQRHWLKAANELITS